MQNDAETHDTLARELWLTAGSGVRCTAQAVPFHDSASVRLLTLLLWKYPTAVQDVSEPHDTLTRVLGTAPAGLGVAWTAHAPPSDDTARVR
jgi:hypothetical protein